MKHDKHDIPDTNQLYEIIEDMAEYICYLESLLDMHDIEYAKIEI